MARKKSDTQYVFVGRHRKKRQADGPRKRRSLKLPSNDETQAGGEAERAAGEASATGRRRRTSSPPPALPQPRPKALYRTIPLHAGDERKQEEAQPDSGSTSSGWIASTNWLGLDFGVVKAPWASGLEEAAHGSPDGDCPDAPRPAGNSKPSALKKLDSVVHDFVASLDDGASAGLDVATSAHAQRFMRLLEFSPSTTGPVLGPPVLFGASPHIGLESTLGLLGSLRKTGVLRVQAQDMTFTVSIVNGDVVHGVSYPRPESDLLGNILVSLGTIDANGLDRFLNDYGSSTSKIGEALNKQALVSTDELQVALEYQLRRLFDRLLAARESLWCFHEGEATLAYINMRMNVIGMLLESARKNDEQSAG